MIDVKNKTFNDIKFEYNYINDEYYIQIDKANILNLYQDYLHIERDRYQRERIFKSVYDLKESMSNSWPRWAYFDRKFSAGRKYNYLNNNNYSFLADVAITDHTELYYLSKDEYIYISQPYNLTWNLFEQFYTLWTDKNLYVNLSTSQSWWCPGLTCLITLSNFNFQFI